MEFYVGKWHIYLKIKTRIKFFVAKTSSWRFGRLQFNEFRFNEKNDNKFNQFTQNNNEIPWNE